MDPEQYSFKFTSKARVLSGPEAEPYLKSHAALEYLKPLVPNDIDLATNDDVAIIVGHVATINKGNRNHHLVDSMGATKLVSTAKYKMVNLEHKRKDAVGVILSANLYSYEGQILTAEEALALKDPYYLSICALIWKSSVPGLEDYIRDTDVETQDGIAFSWELKFRDYYLAAGNVNLASADLIQDKEEIAKLKSKLSMFGGNNKMPDNKTPLYMVACGDDLLFEAVALTLSPAAYVPPVELVEDEEEENTSEASTQENNDLDIENKINSSQKENTTVTLTMDKIEKIEKVEQITDENLVNIKASAVIEFIDSELTKASEQYAKEIKEKQEAIEAAVLKSEADAKKLKELEDKVTELVNVQAAKEAEELFNARMSSLDEEYELDDDSRAIVAKQIKDLSVESYDVWAADFAKLNKKSKKVKEDPKAKKEKEEPENTKVKASTDENIDANDLLNKGTQVIPPILNQQTIDKSKKEIWAEAFGVDSFEVSRGPRSLKKSRKDEEF